VVKVLLWVVLLSVCSGPEQRDTEKPAVELGPDAPPWSQARRNAMSRQAMGCTDQSPPGSQRKYRRFGTGSGHARARGPVRRCDVEYFLCAEIARGRQATDAEKATCASAAR
jgi:hypothetical protein